MDFLKLHTEKLKAEKFLDEVEYLTAEQEDQFYNCSGKRTFK